VSVNGTNLEELEVTYLSGLLSRFNDLLDSVNNASIPLKLEVGAVLQDAEIFWWGTLPSLFRLLEAFGLAGCWKPWLCTCSKSPLGKHHHIPSSC
jgi:hypothetical protein